MIVSYPGHFPKDQINTTPMELMDLVPTAFELAGVKNPNETAQNGMSIVPLLTETSSKGREFAFSEILGAQSATGERYRYITCEGQEFLYDHKTDPWEMKNIAAEFPEITSRMRKAVEKWMSTTGPIEPPNTY